MFKFYSQIYCPNFGSGFRVQFPFHIPGINLELSGISEPSAVKSTEYRSKKELPSFLFNFGIRIFEF